LIDFPTFWALYNRESTFIVQIEERLKRETYRERKKMIIFKCSKCGHEYKVADEYAGKKARCKNCENVNVIPAPTAKPAQPARPVGSGDSVAAYNNLLQELLQQEKTAPTVEVETK